MSGSPGETYFAERPRSRRRPRLLRFLYRGELLRFEVDRGVFAGHGLDRGTELLIENALLRPTDRVLDVGCGWGALGIAAAKSAPQGHVILTEVNRRAAELARRNLRLNELSNAEVRIGPLYAPVEGERFDVIVTNPPYRAGRELVLRLLGEAERHLLPGGRLLFVGKGSQGVLYYQRWLEERRRGKVSVLGRGSGYRAIEYVLSDERPLDAAEVPRRRPRRSA